MRTDEDLIGAMCTAPVTVEQAVAFLRDIGVDIGLLVRAHEGCKAWVADPDEPGRMELYMDRHELRAAASAFAVLAEHVERQSVPGKCPDGGTCHHACLDGPCSRVVLAGPLSGVYDGDRWPDEVYRAHGERLSQADRRRLRGTRIAPCEECGQIGSGNDGGSFHRCNVCGYPGK